MKKKFLAALLSAVTILSVTACSDSAGDNKSDSTTPAGTTAAAESQTTGGSFKIGIVQIVEHPSLNDVRTALIQQLADKGYNDGKEVTIDYQNAQGDQSNLNTIVQNFVSTPVDLIVAIATPSAQAAQGATSTIPIVFAAVTDPVDAGLVDSLDKPGLNITGTSDRISAEDLMNLADRITPDIKTVGALYSASEANSASTVADLKTWAEANGVTVIDGAFVNSNEVQQATASLVTKVDAIFIPTDNTVASSMPIVADVAIGAKIPVYCGADTMVTDGGLASYGVDYKLLGQDTADMIVSIIGGTKPGDIAVKTMSKFDAYVNTDTAAEIGVTIPDDVLGEAIIVNN